MTNRKSLLPFQVWLISCTLFVFLALMEYFIVLFGIRYDKHWRTVKSSGANRTLHRASPSPIRLLPPNTVQMSNEAPVLPLSEAT